MKTLFLMLLPLITLSQDKWYKINGNDWGIIATQAVAGGFEGWNQGIQHHHWGRGNQFWDINVSWKNKYKDYDKGDLRSAYPFSKNILAFTTDGFHLTRSVSRTATLATIAIAASDWKVWPKKERWKVVAKKVVLSIVANRAAFLIVYH